MGRTVAIGIQNFNEIIEKNYFYVDKTSFIKEWWGGGDSVTLITRPRRFGKTLTMSMVEQFFSVDYAGRGDLFEGLRIWQDKDYRAIQGTYPVISLSFANVKEKTYQGTRDKICRLLVNLYTQYDFLLEGDILKERDKEYFRGVSVNMSDSDASLALYQLSDYLYRYYGKKVIILLDEYDTPMQEAYVDGYWEDLVAFTRSLFNATRVRLDTKLLFCVIGLLVLRLITPWCISFVSSNPLAFARVFFVVIIVIIIVIRRWRRVII